MTTNNVLLHIYDVTKGLAKSLSLALLGKQIEGVWHTGIVVYQKEFFFGGTGIDHVTPGGTILGAPDKVLKLGSTDIPEEIFTDYLEDLAHNDFRPECYDLFHHNCNNFSNEVAQFLTGSCIPAHITALPKEVLGTPLGMMIKSFADGMNQERRDRPSFEERERFTGGTVKLDEWSIGRDQATSAKDNAVLSSKQPVNIFPDDKVLEEIKSQNHSLTVNLSASETSLVSEIIEFLSASSPDWSLSPAHFKLLVNLGNVEESTDSQLNKRSVLACRVLQQLCAQQSIRAMIGASQAVQLDLIKLIKCTHSNNDDKRDIILKMICNCFASVPNDQWLISTHHFSSGNDSVSYVEIICKFCAHGILNTKNSGYLYLANRLACTQNSVVETIAVELGSALLQIMTDDQLDETRGCCALSALALFMKTSPELVQLVNVIGLDLTHAKQWKEAKASCDIIESLTKDGKE